MEKINKKKTSILLVEDDENLGFILKDYLEISGYTVDLQRNGVTGLKAFTENNFDICILDIMMPLKDGFSLAKDIREINTTVPIIFLTAKTMKEDKIKGFKLGADDFITKPFSSEELGLRIEAILRRFNYQDALSDAKDKFKIGKFSFVYSNQTLEFEGKEQSLTRKEADVLKLLCLNKNKLLRREDILINIWGSDDYFMGRSMDVYITKLRKHLKKDENIKIINIHGTGFKLEDNSE